ncbi:PH domain-containing protein [Cytobacillus sp. Hm23]
MFEKRRLHPISALLSIISFIKSLIIPIIVFFFIGSGDDGMILSYVKFISFGVGFIGVLVAGFLYWYSYTYRVEDGELRIEHGVFIKKKRYIPIEKIQTFDISQGVLHRLFKLVKVRVETAGGGKEAEAELTAITSIESRQLERALMEQTAQQFEEQMEEEHTHSLAEEGKDKVLFNYKVSTKELLIAGSTSGGIGVVLSAIIAFFSQFEELIPYEIIVNRFEQYLNLGPLLVIITAMFAIFIAWVIAFINTMLKYGNFTIEKYENELVIIRGIIEKRKVTVPLGRIQAIRISENIIRQPLGFATVFVEIAGASTDMESGMSTMLFPIIKKKKLAKLINEILVDYHIPISKTKLPKRSLIRYMLRSIYPVTIIVVPMVIFLRPWGYASILLFVVAMVFGYVKYRGAQWSLDEKQLFMQFRTIGKTTVLMQRKKIQACTMQQSYFQKRKSLCTITSSIKSSASGKHFNMIDMEFFEGRAVHEWYSNGGSNRSENVNSEHLPISLLNRS